MTSVLKWPLVLCSIEELVEWRCQVDSDVGDTHSQLTMTVLDGSGSHGDVHRLNKVALNVDIEPDDVMAVVAITQVNYQTSNIVCIRLDLVVH